MLEHGGNLALAAQQYNIPLENWLDLSTGINPENYPIPAIPTTLWQRLPLDNDGLIEAACAYYGCQHALPVAGSQAALQTLPKLRAPGKVAMLNPMYREHAHAWQSNGHQVSLFSDYPDEDTLNSADVVLLCNPNNPTAMQFTNADLLKWHTQLAKHGGWLIVDEAFMDAVPQQSIAAYAHLEGLFVLRSLGKFFGLAGARVGFLLGNQQALHQVQEEIGPWSVSGTSRFVAKQALSDFPWQQHTRKQLNESSQRMAALLRQYGLTPQSGTALFQYIPTTQAVAWQQHLAQHGIWLRLFTEPLALRFGLPPANQWDRLETALKAFLPTQY